MLYVHKRNFSRRYPHAYLIKSAVVNRGLGSKSVFDITNRPPKKWFDSPITSGEIVVAIANIHLEGMFIKFDKYITTIHPSSIYTHPVVLEEILDSGNVVWID